MAFQFVYRHGAAGYAIHGIHDHALKQLVIEQLESDRVDPHLLERSPVWRWMQIGPAHWCVMNSSLRAAPTGRQALEVRGVVLNAVDGEAIRWNPFLIVGVFADDGMWQQKHFETRSEVDLRSWLHRSSSTNRDAAKGETDGRKWQVVTFDTTDLARGMDLFSKDKRKRVEITATIDPEGLRHRLLARSYESTKAKSADTAKSPSKVVLGFVAFCALGVTAGIWMWSVSSDRNSLEAALRERDELLLSRENALDSTREERDRLRRQHASDRDAIRRQLLQLATVTIRAAELPGSIVDDIRRRRGHIQHYLDQAMLQEALEEWVGLESAYGVAESRIHAINNAAESLKIQLQKLLRLYEQLNSSPQIAMEDDRIRKQLDSAINAVEHGALELQRILEMTETDASSHK